MNTNALMVAVAFLVAGADKPGELKEIAAWKGPGEATAVLRFSPDGKTLVLGGDGEKAEVELWDARTGRKISTLGSLGRDISLVAFAPDGKSLAAIDSNGAIKVWDMATRKERTSFAGDRRSRVSALVFSADGRNLVMAEEKAVCALALEDGKRTTLFQRRVHGYGALFSPDGKTLASPNYQDLDLWDVDTGKIRRILADHHGGVEKVAFSADGKIVAVPVQRNEGYNTYQWEVKCYEAETGKEQVTISSDGGVLHSIGLDDKAQTLLVQHQPPLPTKRFNPNDELRVYDLATGRECCARKTLGRYSHAVLSPDGKMLATVEPDNQIKVWELPPVATEKKP